MSVEFSEDKFVTIFSSRKHSAEIEAETINGLLESSGLRSMIVRDNVRELPGRYGHMQLVEIPESGHHIFLTHTRTCLRMIEQHLNGHAPSRSRVSAAVRRLLGNPT